MKYTIYTITTIDEGRVVYVGKTNNFKRRKREHLSLNSRTKEWIAAIGTGNVLIEPVAEFDNETDALKYEDELILEYDTITNGYNKNRSGLIKAENPKEYYNTDKWKDYHREYNIDYEQTDKWKKYHRDYQRDYQRTEK